MVTLWIFHLRTLSNVWGSNFHSLGCLILTYFDPFCWPLIRNRGQTSQNWAVSVNFAGGLPHQHPKTNHWWDQTTSVHFGMEGKTYSIHSHHQSLFSRGQKLSKMVKTECPLRWQARKMALKCWVAIGIARFRIGPHWSSLTKCLGVPVQGMKGNDMKEDNKNWLMRLVKKWRMARLESGTCRRFGWVLMVLKFHQANCFGPCVSLSSFISVLSTCDQN